MKNLFKSGLLLLLISSGLVAKAQYPVLNSHPSATAVIFLDFDGQTVENTDWNYYITPPGPIYCGPSGLNNTQITEVFNRIAEDYRPFNVNITTDSTKYFAAPLTNRMRVIVTITSDWWPGAGGVAFVNSFSEGTDLPCFVFSAALSYNPKYIAEAGAHEAGHTLGLLHQSTYNASCVKTAEYNPGIGSGEIGWAPIMGVGYSKNMTLWNNGPNSNGCSNMQSDLDVIIDVVNGFSYRSDDHANNFAGATISPFVNNVFNVSGVVERNTDADYFTITMTANGRFQLNAIPMNVGAGNSGSDLDLQVSLYNNSQVLLNVYNPGTLLNSIIDSGLNAGTYYLKVEGKGNMYAPNYASLGSYALQGTFSLSTLPLRKLELRGELVSDKHKLTWIIDADEAITKQILEISTDGRHFSPVTQSANDTRSFLYKPYVSSTAQYRLNVTFDNGHQYYSNVVSLRNTGTTDWPKLISNITSNNIIVSSPGSYSFTIYEYNGKTVSNGQLSKGLNTISTTPVTSGMYIIRFTNGIEQWNDKFVKQ